MFLPSECVKEKGSWLKDMFIIVYLFRVCHCCQKWSIPLTSFDNFSDLFPRFCGRLKTGSVLRPVRPVPSRWSRSSLQHTSATATALAHRHAHALTMVALMWHWCGIVMFDDVWWPICSKTFQDMISIDHKDTQMVEQFHSSHANSYSSSLAQWGKHRSSLAALRCPAMPGLPFAFPFWPPLRFLALPWPWRRPK
jgi:hypothetical protein